MKRWVVGVAARPFKPRARLATSAHYVDDFFVVFQKLDHEVHNFKRADRHLTFFCGRHPSEESVVLCTLDCRVSSSKQKTVQKQTAHPLLSRLPSPLLAGVPVWGNKVDFGIIYVVIKN
jgi:hypothetical protein